MLWKAHLRVSMFVILSCRVVTYLSRVLEPAFTSLEGLNKQAFLTELVQRLMTP